MRFEVGVVRRKSDPGESWGSLRTSMECGLIICLEVVEMWQVMDKISEGVKP